LLTNLQVLARHHTARGGLHDADQFARKSRTKKMKMQLPNFLVRRPAATLVFLSTLLTVPGTAAAVNVSYSGHSNNAAGATLASSPIQSFGGYRGVRNSSEPSGSPQHAVDNNVQTDAVLFTFDSDVRLTRVLFGWSQTDADFSVLYSTGANPCLAGYTIATLRNDATCQANGNNWTLLGSYDANASGSLVTTNLSSNGIFARRWLVMAYYPFDNSCASCTAGNDYFKVDVRYEERKVPEPGSLALLGLGLAGLGLGRRRPG
jgi:hypothetical protein